MAESQLGYQCKFCLRKIANERIFMKHECQQMIRAAEIKTVEGQTAYALYKRWLEGQRKKAPSIETFATSTYYGSFMKFAVWVRETGIPDAGRYVDLMNTKKISPALWRRNDAYVLFLEWADRRSDPYEQAATTVETVLQLAEGLEVEPKGVFKSFEPGQILELIQQRRLSPWLLFCSRSFKDWIATLHESDRTALMRGIGVDYWALKLEKHPEVVRSLKETAEQLGI